MASYDLVFRKGAVYDGTGAPAAQADVAVVDDRIVHVGEVVGAGSVEVDAGGMAIAPGFIDVHSHDDFAALLTPDLPFKLLQGVTTEIVGNCGMGAAPFAPARKLAQTLHPGCVLPTWIGYAGYLRCLDEAPPSANVAVLAGHGSLRAEALGDNRRPAEKDEIDRLLALLDEAMDAGAFGMSSGLIYEPGCYALAEELWALARRLPSNASYTTHIRNEADLLVEAVQEAVELCEQTGARLQLSHHKANGRNNWGRVVESLALVDAARARGRDVWLDVYPYAAGSTLLSSVVASGRLTGQSSMGTILPDDVVLASVAGRPELEGRALGELSYRWGLDVSGAARRVLEADADSWVVIHGMCEEDVRRVLRHPASMIGSDGIPRPGGRPHPRLYGTFPRVLGHYARDAGVLSLEAAIHKMTDLPARCFGLQRRGRVAPGYFADLVLFDPATLRDGSTFEEPRRPPRGLYDVYVNGRAVVRRGQHLGTRPGRALRRAA